MTDDFDLLDFGMTLSLICADWKGRLLNHRLLCMHVNMSLVCTTHMTNLCLKKQTNPIRNQAQKAHHVHREKV